MLVDNVSGWFLEHPIYDAKGQPIVVPEFRFPGRGRVQAQLGRAKKVLTAGEKVLQNLPLRGRQAEWSAQIETKRVEIERALTLRRALRPVHRVRGDLPGRQPHAHVGRTERRRPGRVQLRPPLGRLADVHHPGPPALDRPARTGQDHARAGRVDRPHGAHAQAGARPQASGRGVRPREHADRVERRGELLVAGHTPPRHPRAGSLLPAHASPRGRACSSSTAPTAPTSCATSTAATKTPRSNRSNATPARCSPR